MKHIHLLCWLSFFALLVLPISLIVRERHLPQSINADFAYFYGMGRIAGDYPAEKLYDSELQKKVFNDVHRLPKGLEYGPSPYPPFVVVVLFRQLARLSYPAAYLVWFSVSFALYLAGLAIVSAPWFSLDPLRRSLIFCFALSFFPFTLETLFNGHLSTIGFFAMALAIYEDFAARPLRSGLALSACLYKPTLLILLLPMLLVTRRFRTLAGFAVGAVALMLVATLVEGPAVWPGYIHLLLHFGKSSTGAASILPLRKYVDMAAFSSLLPGGRTLPGLVMLGGGACVAAVSLVRLWWKSVSSGPAAGPLVWAATITWTLILNVYVPVYDCILVVLSIVVTAGLLRKGAERRLDRWFTVLWVLILATSWITVNVAEATGIQLITLLLVALGILQFKAFRTLAR